MGDKVYIILLNYNSWKDSIECIESLYKLNYKNFRVVLVDNASPNNSVEFIEEWAKGNWLPEFDSTHPLFELSESPILKPMDYLLLDESELDDQSDSKLTIIKAKSNNGFSAG